MEAQLSESSVFPSQSYAASFFSKFPTDSRFLKVSHQSFMPVRVIDGKDIEFSLDRYSAGNVLLIQDTTLNVRLQILTSDGISLPIASKFVAPRNNILHTLFSSVALHINDVQISSAPDNYCYKAYITNAISYSAPAKSTHLELQGYIEDTYGYFDSANPEINMGFGQRMNLFRSNMNSNFGYRPEGAMFSGRLYHELSSCETGLPPNTKVRIVLTKNKDSFILQCPENDDEKYQVKITNIFLTVPIAQLSQNVYDELSYLMSKKPVTIQFRKFEVLPISVPKDKQDYQSGDLFTDGDLPCRIILAFVDAKARLGDYHKNPYNFLRKWEIEQEAATSVEHRIKYLEELVQKLSRNQSILHDETESATLSGASSADPQATSFGSSSGPNLVSSQPSTSAGPSTSATDMTSSTVTTRSISSNLSRQTAASVASLQSTSDTVNIDDQINSLLAQKLKQFFPNMHSNDANDASIADDETLVWISNIKVTINNAPVDQIEDSQTEDECLNSYFRLCQTIGVLNSPFASGISYDAFRYLNIYIYTLYG